LGFLLFVGWGLFGVGVVFLVLFFSSISNISRVCSVLGLKLCRGRCVGFGWLCVLGRAVWFCDSFRLVESCCLGFWVWGWRAFAGDCPLVFPRGVRWGILAQSVLGGVFARVLFNPFDGLSARAGELRLTIVPGSWSAATFWARGAPLYSCRLCRRLLGVSCCKAIVWACAGFGGAAGGLVSIWRER
jgi:hypothetical protein